MRTSVIKLLIVAVVSTMASSSGMAQVVEILPLTRGVPPRGMAFGASLVGNINFSVQAYPAKGARFQKNSYFFPTGELLGSFTWPHGWRVESGLGFGSVASVTIDAREQFGQAATVSFGTIQVPLRLYRYLSLGSKSRYSIAPFVGGQIVTLSSGEKLSARYPIYPGKPDYGSQSKSFRSVQSRAFTYQTGLSFNYIAPKLEVNTFIRYTNSFGNPIVAEGNWEYDLQGIEQQPLHSISRLENVAIGIAVRRTFFAH